MNTKENVRNSSLKLLKSTPSERNRYFSKHVNKNLLFLLKRLKACNKRILFYLPMDHEADITPTMKHFRKKTEVYLPFMENVSFKMVAYRLPLEVGKYKIRQPRVTKRDIKNVDIIVVPTIAVDKVFKRVGFGKGMYDRFYEKLKIKPITIFVQPFLCYENSVITNAYDIAGDYVVTSRGILKKEVRDVNRNNRRKRCQRGVCMVSHKKIPYRQTQFLSERGEG